MGAYDTYIQGWRDQARRTEQARREREADARRLVPILVQHLVESHGARRVILIGSLVRGGFDLGSDIDLLVEGLVGASLFRAGAELEELARPIHVDLVALEDLQEELRAKMEAAGEVLHEG